MRVQKEHICLKDDDKYVCKCLIAKMNGIVARGEIACPHFTEEAKLIWSTTINKT